MGKHSLPYWPDIWPDELELDLGKFIGGLSGGGYRAGTATARGELLRQPRLRLADPRNFRRPVSFGMRFFVASVAKPMKGQVTQYVKYLAKQRGANEMLFFDADPNNRSVDGLKLAQEWEKDGKAYGLYYAPNDGDVLSPHSRAFARGTMRRMEMHLFRKAGVPGTKLQWFGIVHRQGNRAREKSAHVHIVIRGKDSRGQEVRFSNETIAKAFTEMAARQAEDMLGPMTLVERQNLRLQLREQARIRKEEKLEKLMRMEARADERIEMEEGIENGMERG